MKLHPLFIALIVSCFTISCGNSSKNQQSEATTQQINPLEKVFKEAYDKKETLYDLVRKDIIKERIISEYSTNFYNKALEYVVFAYEIVYKDGKYAAYGSLTRLDETSVDLTYEPISDLLTVRIKEEDMPVQSNGEVHYNTEGWHISYEDYKNDFGEIVRREPVAGYRIENEEDELLAPDKIFFVVRPQYLTLWTNLWGSNDSVKDIRIKDNITDKIYMIDFEDHYHLKNEGLYRDNIGVFIFGDEYKKFIQLISSLDDYVISIRSVYGQNLILRNPENLNNILDAYKKILSMPRK